MNNVRTRFIGKLGAVLLTATFFVCLATNAAAQIAPPPFSRDIQTLFPGAPLITCLIGQFEPPGATATSPSLAQFWFVKAEQTGSLTIEVRAVAVNPAEAGSIIATFFDGSPAPPVIQVFHPSGTFGGDEAVGFLTVPVQANTIYTMAVQRGPSFAGQPEAHHYKLGFSSVPVDVGINSPTFGYLEPGPQVFHLNLAAEDLSLQVSSDFPNLTNPQASIEISRRDNGQVLLSQSALGFSSPTTLNLPNPFGGFGGTLVLKINANVHYRLDKLSGDRGLYFDTCPPPEAPPPPPPPPPGIAEPRTIGFWKNHETETTAKLPIPLGNYVVDTFVKAKALFDEAHAKNAHDMLAAQFLAMRLNKLSGVPSGCVLDAENRATEILVKAGYMGPGTTAAPAGADKEAVNTVKDQLDKFNNSGCP